MLCSSIFFDCLPPVYQVNQPWYAGFMPTKRPTRSAKATRAYEHLNLGIQLAYSEEGALFQRDSDRGRRTAWTRVADPSVFDKSTFLEIPAAKIRLPRTAKQPPLDPPETPSGHKTQERW